MKKILFSVLMMALTLPVWADDVLPDPGHPINPGNYQVTVTADAAQGSVSGLSASGLYSQGASVTLTAVPETGYEFVQWSEGGTSVSTDNPYTFKVQKDVTLTAVFQKLKYTVIWKNEDGTVLETDENVEYGATPSYDGATPTKTGDAQYTYTFDKWSPAVAAVTGDVTYTATFKSSVNKYTVIWKNEDGTVLETDENVEYGATPSYDGATPTKAADAQYTYTFDKWSPAVAAVTGDVTYTATFTGNIKSYTVSFNANGYGTAPTDQIIKYGSKVSKPADLSETGYTFGGWYKEADCTNAWDFANDVVTGALELFAKWTPNTNTPYIVNHYKQTVAGDGWDLEETDNLTGTTGASVTPARKSYEGFTAPDPQTVTINADGSRVVTYNYTRNSYTLAWELDGGSISVAGTAAGSVKYEAPLTAPTVIKEGYTFDGWNPEVAATMPAANTTYTATWKAADSHYTVKHWQQNIADDEYTEVVADREDKTGETGKNTAAAAKSYTGFNALAFSQKAIAADGSTAIDIYYDRIEYTVTFVVEGEEKQSSDWRYGALPVYSGAEPEKEATTLFTYTFAGWDPEIAAVTEAATYTATFDAEAIVAAAVEVTGDKNASELPIGATTEITVAANGHLTISEALTAKSLTLVYGADARAQVTGITNLTVEKMEVVLSLPEMEDVKYHWFAIAVPFEVSLVNGVHVGASSAPARSAYEFYIDEYDGAQRASTQDGWKRVPADGKLVPGKLYMLYVGSDGDWRFTATAPSAITEPETVDVAANVSEAGSHHSGWNGIASTLFDNATGSADDLLLATFYDNANGVYQAEPLAGHEFVPAEPFFVQVDADEEFSFSNSAVSPVAPRAVAEEEMAVSAVTLSDIDFAYTDKAYVAVTEQKAVSGYHIGRDLVKMTPKETPVVPQLWLEAYDLQLAAYEAEVGSEQQLSIPVGLFAPAEGRYVLAMSKLPSDVSVYLTKDGQLLWDMNNPIVLDLQAGNNEGYALNARRIPAVVTDLEAIEAVGGVQKLMMGGHMFIIRDGKAFNATGVQVK